MIKTVFIQTIPHYPTAWGDAINSWNIGSYFRGMGSWHAREFTQQLGLWNRQNYNIIVDKHPTDADKLLIRKAGVPAQIQNGNFCVEVDLKTAFDYLDESPETRTCAFGYFIDADKEVPTADMFSGCTWFARDQGDKKVYKTDEEIQAHTHSKLMFLPSREHVSDDSKLSSLVWFFIYRSGELPIYYIIPNPDLLGVSKRIEDVLSSDVRYRMVDQHFGTVGDLIFRPSFSNNVVPLTPSKVMVGDEFEIRPFENGVFSWGFKEDFPKVSIKVVTDLEYVKYPESNRIRFKFSSKEKDRGFVSLRWNTGTLMDISMSSYTYDYVQNKCHVMYDVYRNSSLKFR